MRCHTCEQQIEDGAPFCPNCGSDFSHIATASEQAPAAPSHMHQQPAQHQQPQTLQHQQQIPQQQQQPLPYQQAQPYQMPAVNQPQPVQYPQHAQQEHQQPQQAPYQWEPQPAPYQQEAQPMPYLQDPQPQPFPHQQDPQPQTPPHEQDPRLQQQPKAAKPPRSKKKALLVGLPLLAAGIAATILFLFVMPGTGTADTPPVTRAQWMQMLVAASTNEALLADSANDVFDEIFSDVNASTEGYMEIYLAAGFGWLDYEIEEGFFDPHGAATRDFVAGTSMLATGYVFIDDEVEIADIGDLNEVEQYFYTTAVLAGFLDLDGNNRINLNQRAEAAFAEGVAERISERRAQLIAPDGFENVVTLLDTTIDLSDAYRSGEILPLDEDEYEFMLSRSAASLITEGSVFVATPSDGVIYNGIARKVTELKNDGDSVYIATEMPVIEEVFYELRIWESIDLGAIEASYNYDNFEDMPSLAAMPSATTLSADTAAMPEATTLLASPAAMPEATTLSASPAAMPEATTLLADTAAMPEATNLSNEKPIPTFTMRIGDFSMTIHPGSTYNYRTDYKKDEQPYSVMLDVTLKMTTRIIFTKEEYSHKIENIIGVPIPTQYGMLHFPLEIKIAGDGVIAHTNTFKFSFGVNPHELFMPGNQIDFGLSRGASETFITGSIKGEIKAGASFQAGVYSFSLVNIDLMQGAGIGVSFSQDDLGYCAHFNGDLFKETAVTSFPFISKTIGTIAEALYFVRNLSTFEFEWEGDYAHRNSSSPVVRFLRDTLKPFNNTIGAIHDRIVIAEKRVNEILVIADRTITERIEFHWEDTVPLDIFYPERGYWPAQYDNGDPRGFCTRKPPIVLQSPSVLNLRVNPSAPAVIGINYFGRRTVTAVYDEEYTIEDLTPGIVSSSGNILNGHVVGTGRIETTLRVRRNLMLYDTVGRIDSTAWGQLWEWLGIDIPNQEELLAQYGEIVDTVRKDEFDVEVIDREESPPTGITSDNPNGRYELWYEDDMYGIRMLVMTMEFHPNNYVRITTMETPQTPAVDVIGTYTVDFVDTWEEHQWDPLVKGEYLLWVYWPVVPELAYYPPYPLDPFGREYEEEFFGMYDSRDNTVNLPVGMGYGLQTFVWVPGPIPPLPPGTPDLPPPTPTTTPTTPEDDPPYIPPPPPEDEEPLPSVDENPSLGFMGMYMILDKELTHPSDQIVYHPGEEIKVMVFNMPRSMQVAGAQVVMYVAGASHEEFLDHYLEYHYPVAGYSELFFTAPSYEGEFEMRLYSREFIYTDQTLALRPKGFEVRS